MGSNIGSSNYFSVSASSNKGMSGLVSNMDTEGLVKQMLSGTQKKIDKLNQQKQQIDWKREIYRDAISTINGFRTKFMDTSYGASSKNNIASAAFFNTMKSAITGGNSVKIISTGSNALAGDISVKVNQLAEAAKLTSDTKMSGNQTIDGFAMDVESIKATFAAEKDMSFELSLDGVTKTLTFSAEEFKDTEVTSASITDALQAKVKQAFGTYVNVTNTNDKLSFSLNINDADGNPEVGHELKITGADAKEFGITPGSSSLISGMTKLGELTGTTGDKFEFTINGEKFSFSSDTTVSGMMNKINKSSAGVKMSYSSITDSFSMEATSTGAQYGIEISQEKGNVLTQMFGSGVVGGASSAASKALNTSTITGKTLADDFSTTETSLKMNVNGKDYTFVLPRKENTTYDKATIETKLNDWLKNNFGESKGVANISYENGELKTALGYEVSFDATEIDTNDPLLAEMAGKHDLAIALGFSKKEGGATNAITADTNIADLATLEGVNFLKADGTAATTLSEIASIENRGQTISASFKDGRLDISGTGTHDFSGTKLEALFSSSVTFDDGQMTAGVVKKGADARIEINKVETSRSSNTFTIDGITMTATKVDTGDEKTTIGTVRDIDTVVEGIKSFVTDYNSMIKKLSERVSEKSEYRDYPPLTEAQKADMSDKQVELWEEKAKTGLVRSDTELYQFIDSIKNAGMGLFRIGIDNTTSKIGELSIDEAALRNVLSTDPEAVTKLFTDSETGIATRMAQACDYTAKVSSANPGTLVTLAGAEGWAAGEKNNDLYEQLTDINDRLEYLTYRYNTQKERYWQQMSQMETILASYSSQSNMIGQQFASF